MALVPVDGSGPAREVIPFQGDVTAIELQPAPRWARCTILLVALTLVTACFWAAYAPIDKIVRAPGKLVTTEPKLVVLVVEGVEHLQRAPEYGLDWFAFTHWKDRAS